jgi:hypothetical protein
MEHEIIVVGKNVPTVKKRDIEDGFEISHTTSEDASGWAIHTESCPHGCYRFVSRYLVKTHVEAESATADCDRSAANLLKVA